MKKLLILAYVVAVLLLSGMVKGGQNGRALIENAQIKLNGIISVNGLLPTPCHQNPRLVVAKIDETQNVLNLAIQTQLKDQICPDVIVNTPFKLVFDLKQLPLRVGSTYNIIFDNYEGEKKPFTYKAVSGDYNFSDLNFDQNNFKGKLINYKIPGSLSDEVGFALQNGNDILPVVATDLAFELSAFEGGEVRMTGYVLSTATLLNGESDSLTPSSQVEKVIVPTSVSQ